MWLRASVSSDRSRLISRGGITPEEHGLLVHNAAEFGSALVSSLDNL
jgi:hypothetical protein